MSAPGCELTSAAPAGIDILVFTRDADAGVHVATSDGARFRASTRWTQFDPPGPFPRLGTLFGGVPEVGDFDGDGTFDIVAFGEDVFVALSDGVGFGVSTRWAEDALFVGSSAGRTGVGDVNGDGRDDVFKYSADAAHALVGEPRHRQLTKSAR